MEQIFFSLVPSNLPDGQPKLIGFNKKPHFCLPHKSCSDLLVQVAKMSHPAHLLFPYTYPYDCSFLSHFSPSALESGFP